MRYQAHQPDVVFPQTHLQRMVDTVEQFYTFKEPTKTRRFLQERPDFLEVLVDALPVIQRNFEFSDLIVELTPPVEPGERTGHDLYIRIATPTDVDEALELLERFDNGWWLDQPADIRDRICFDIDFT